MCFPTRSLRFLRNPAFPQRVFISTHCLIIWTSRRQIPLDFASVIPLLRMVRCSLILLRSLPVFREKLTLLGSNSNYMIYTNQLPFIMSMAYLSVCFNSFVDVDTGCGAVESSSHVHHHSVPPDPRTRSSLSQGSGETLFRSCKRSEPEPVFRDWRVLRAHRSHRKSLRWLLRKHN